MIPSSAAPAGAAPLMAARRGCAAQDEKRSPTRTTAREPNVLSFAATISCRCEGKAIKGCTARIVPNCSAFRKLNHFGVSHGRDHQNARSPSSAVLTLGRMLARHFFGVESKRGRIRRVKYWETIANKSINARDDDRRTVWIVDAHRDGRRFIVRAEEKLTAFVELQAANHRQPASSQSADGAGRPMLNSARRHCTSPRRGRGVEWSDQRRGSVRLHFRAGRICRRCASDASQESVGNAGTIDETTTDKSLVTDSVKRCKG